MGCLFCDIIEKKRSAAIRYEDDLAVAFEDINPQAPVHVLVVPKKHIATILDATKDENGLVGHLFQVANKIARDKGIADGGFRLVMNCNVDAGQTVYHIHLHVLGGRIMRWPPG
jgi:histidine triad (HIT) family protein